MQELDNPNTKEEAVIFKQTVQSFGSMRAAVRSTGIPRTTLRRRDRKATTLIGSEAEKPIAGGQIRYSTHTRKKLSGKRFVFTSAQNNTYVHDGFLQSLLQFCDHNDAELIIGKFRYNKAGFQNLTEDNDDSWYDPKLAPYFLNEPAEICNGLVWCGELDILPTAVNPFSGMDSYTRRSAGIFPHTKRQMKSVATPMGEDAKFLYTTGAITKLNYIQRKAGQKAEFHHVFGAMYVEIDTDGTWFAFQLNADTKGSFYHFTDYYTPAGVTHGHRVEGINWGDIHAEKMNGVINTASWYGRNSMLNVLRPKYQFIHDLSDFEARNHHNIKDPHFLAWQHYHGVNSVADGLRQGGAFLTDIQRDDCQTVVVESNHDLAFKKWLKNKAGMYDPENACYWHEGNAEIHRQIKNGIENFGIFEWAIRREYNLDNTVFLTENNSFIICEKFGGIDCGMHGHRGVNGARGTANGFRGLGRRCNTGHAHSAGIIDGIYTSGVSAAMDMGYNKGLSSWSYSHIMTYPNSKRCIVTIKNGKYRV